MKSRIIPAVAAALLALEFTAISPAPAEATTPANPWVGVWQGDLDGQPGVIVTLGTDNGALQGTIVFNVVSRNTGGPAQVIGHDAHAMAHLQSSDNTLAFDVMRKSDQRDLHITLHLTADGKAQLTCPDCGGGPLTELERLH